MWETEKEIVVEFLAFHLTSGGNECNAVVGDHALAWAGTLKEASLPALTGSGVSVTPLMASFPSPAVVTKGEVAHATLMALVLRTSYMDS